MNLSRFALGLGAVLMVVCGSVAEAAPPACGAKIGSIEVPDQGTTIVYTTDVCAVGGRGQVNLSFTLPDLSSWQCELTGKERGDLLGIKVTKGVEDGTVWITFSTTTDTRLGHFSWNYFTVGASGYPICFKSE